MAVFSSLCLQQAYTNAPFHEGLGHMPDSESLFGDSGETNNPYDAIYGELDLHRVYGQQIAMWTHKNPDTICLFTPIPGDTFMTIVSYARNSLEFNTAVDKVIAMKPCCCHTVCLICYMSDRELGEGHSGLKHVQNNAVNDEYKTCGKTGNWQSHLMMTWSRIHGTHVVSGLDYSP